MILQFSYPDGLIKWCGASRSLLAGALKALSLQREHQLPTDRFPQAAYAESDQTQRSEDQSFARQNVRSQNELRRRKRT